MTMAGNGKANSSTKSPSPRGTMSSNSSSAIAATLGSSRAIAVGRNAERNVRRWRAWSGSSVEPSTPASW